MLVTLVPNNVKRLKTRPGSQHQPRRASPAPPPPLQQSPYSSASPSADRATRLNMTSTAPYGDTDDKAGGGPAMFVNQNGGTPPQQQQQHHHQQHIPTDPELQLREQLQMHQGTDMMHQAPHLQQINAMNATHHHFQTPPRPVHSPQHMAQSAQSVMGIDEHNAFAEHDSATRKRSKVSRACDECRRKKVRTPFVLPCLRV